MAQSDNDHSIQLPFAASHAFIIGINDYENVSRLTTAVHDAIALAEQLKSSHGYSVHGPLLNANKKDILQWLHEEMPKVVGADDRVLFYFAGHGIALDSDDNPKGYLVPADAEPGDPATLIPMDELHDTIGTLPCQHGLLIMDCCFAGAFKWSTGFRDVVFDLPGIIYEERFYQYAQDSAWQVITSSASDQKAVDILSNRTLGLRNAEDAEHSPFALALLEGLAGEADTVPKDKGDGVITATELYTYLRDRVEDETIEHGKRQSPSMFSLNRHDKGQYIFLHPNHRYNLPPIPKRNPFMGLRSYNEEDSYLFYGRDRVISALSVLMESTQLVVVSGASGTGKSSVIKAGLLPLLRKRQWNILPVVRPGKEPLASLQAAIPDMHKAIEAETKNVLIVDQYEELITQCLNPADRASFEEQLESWLCEFPNLHIIVSVRSDFEPQFEKAALSAYWPFGRYVVPTFDQDELREVIIKPTVQEVLFFEPDSLVDNLVDAVNQAPGALPLLSFTLSELYHAYVNSGRTNRAFTLEDYEKLGGVIGALRTRANEFYEGLDTGHQDSMRRLMVRMVSVEGGELASRRVLSEDLIFADTEETARVTKVAQQLVETRLLSSGRDSQGHTYYEPAHDALVRAWSRLWEWVKAMGEGKLSLMYKLGLAVADYQNNIKAKDANDYLWNDDPRLDLLYADVVSDRHSYNAREESFLKSSIHLRNKNKRRRWAIVASVMIGLAALTIFAFIQRGIAERQKEAAEMKTRAAEATALAITADNLPRSKKHNALQLLKLGYSKTEPILPPPIVSKTLSYVFYDQYPSKNKPAKPIYKSVFEHSHFVQWASFSPDGQLILTTAGGIARLWDLQGNLVREYGMQHDSIDYAEFSPRENTILVVGENKNARLWNMDGEVIKDFESEKGVRYARFVAQGQYILLDIGGGSSLLCLSDGTPLLPVEREFISASNDGKHLILHEYGGDYYLLNMAGEEIKTFKSPSAIFLNHGRHLVTISQNTLQLWEVPSMKLADSKKLPTEIRRLSTHKENKRFASFVTDSIHLWTTKDNRLVKESVISESVLVLPTLATSYQTQPQVLASSGDFAGYEKPAMFYSFEFSPDGQSILSNSSSPFMTSSGDNGFVNIFNIKGERTLEFLEDLFGISQAIFSPDGQYIFSFELASDNGYLWNLAGELIEEKSNLISNSSEPDKNHEYLAVNLGQYQVTATLYGDSIAEFPLPDNMEQPYVPYDYSDPKFSADGSILISRHYLGEDAMIWDVKTRQLKHYFNGDIFDKIWTLAPSSDGQLVLLQGTDKNLKVLDIASDKIIKEIPLGTATDYYNPIFSPDKHTFAILNKALNTIEVKNMDGEQLCSFPGYVAQFSNDGSTIFVSGDTSATAIYTIHGKLIQDFDFGKARGADFLLDDRAILIHSQSSENRSVLFNIASGEELASFHWYHEYNRPSSGSFQLEHSISPSEKFILSIVQNQVKLWNMEGQVIANFLPFGDYSQAATFTKDEQFVYVFGKDKIIKWPTPERIYTYLKETSPLSDLTPVELQRYGID